MNTTQNNSRSQKQLAIYLNLIKEADEFCGSSATLIQLQFPHDQEHATQLHNEFLKAFEPFRNHLVDYATAALKELCPDMPRQSVEAFTATLDRGIDKGQYTADIQDELQHIIEEEEAEQADNNKNI